MPTRKQRKANGLSSHSLKERGRLGDGAEDRTATSSLEHSEFRKAQPQPEIVFRCVQSLPLRTRGDPWEAHHGTPHPEQS